MSWNGFPKNARKSLISKLKHKHNSNQANVNNISDSPLPKIWFRLPYLGKEGEFLVRNCIKKLRKCLKVEVNFIIIYQTKKISFFVGNKDKIPDTSRSNLVYEITCPGCNKRYIGKTERCLEKRINEHSTDFKNSAVADHFQNCEHAQHLLNMNNLYDQLNHLTSFIPSTIRSLILPNSKVLYSSHTLNFNQLLLLEALFIKFNKPELNTGLRASKELTLFP